MEDLKPVTNNPSHENVQHDVLPSESVPARPYHVVLQPQPVAGKPSEDENEREQVADVLTLGKFLEILKSCKNEILKTL